MREAAVVIGLDGEPIYWHVPEDRSAGSIPDSDVLWNVLWENRDNLLGVAHSHPGGGVPGPSHTDVTTFRAVEAGLGKKLLWWITSSETVVVFHTVHEAFPHDVTYQILPEEPAWAAELRELSR